MEDFDHRQVVFQNSLQSDVICTFLWKYNAQDVRDFSKALPCSVTSPAMIIAIQK